jgi:hypothetical protein
MRVNMSEIGSVIFYSFSSSSFILVLDYEEEDEDD